LKRFEFKNVLRRGKLNNLVNFPLDGLDMSSHCGSGSRETPGFVDETVPADYDLFAVVNHYGRMGFGLYTAFARNWDESGISPEWQLYDDSTIHSMGNGAAGGNDSVVSSAAYVLFYRLLLMSKLYWIRAPLP
jgi:ubiquitin C-terminal hydrolase